VSLAPIRILQAAGLLARDDDSAVPRTQFDLANMSAGVVNLLDDDCGVPLSTIRALQLARRALRKGRGIPENERFTSGFGGREMPNLNSARHRVVRSPFPSKFSDVLDPLSIVFHHCSNLGLL